MNYYTDHETDSFLESELDETVHCYLCYLEQTGRPDDSLKADQGPLRKVIRRSVSKGSDPYSVLHLECGHGII
jgi:hypothetical protein